jgi:hypothetical protein
MLPGFSNVCDVMEFSPRMSSRIVCLAIGEPGRDANNCDRNDIYDDEQALLRNSAGEITRPKTRFARKNKFQEKTQQPRDRSSHQHESQERVAVEIKSRL